MLWQLVVFVFDSHCCSGVVVRLPRRLADAAPACSHPIQDLIEVADACHLDNTKAAGLTKLSALFEQPWWLGPSDMEPIAQRLDRQSLASLLESLLAKLQGGTYLFSVPADTSFLNPRVVSPVIAIGGLHWTVEAVLTNSYPNPSPLAVCLCRADGSSTPVRAHCTLTLLSYTDARFRVSRTYAHTFGPDSPRKSIQNFVSFGDVKASSRGHLDNFVFTIQVDIRVLP